MAEVKNKLLPIPYVVMHEAVPASEYAFFKVPAYVQKYVKNGQLDFEAFRKAALLFQHQFKKAPAPNAEWVVIRDAFNRCYDNAKQSWHQPKTLEELQILMGKNAYWSLMALFQVRADEKVQEGCVKKIPKKEWYGWKRAEKAKILSDHFLCMAGSLATFDFTPANIRSFRKTVGPLVTARYNQLFFKVATVAWETRDLQLATSVLRPLVSYVDHQKGVGKLYGIRKEFVPRRQLLSTPLCRQNLPNGMLVSKGELIYCGLEHFLKNDVRGRHVDFELVLSDLRKQLQVQIDVPDKIELQPGETKSYPLNLRHNVESYPKDFKDSAQGNNVTVSVDVQVKGVRQHVRRTGSVSTRYQHIQVGTQWLIRYDREKEVLQVTHQKQRPPFTLADIQFNFSVTVNNTRLQYSKESVQVQLQKPVVLKGPDQIFELPTEVAMREGERKFFLKSFWSRFPIKNYTIHTRLISPKNSPAPNTEPTITYINNALAIQAPLDRHTHNVGAYEIELTAKRVGKKGGENISAVHRMKIAVADTNQAPECKMAGPTEVLAGSSFDILVPEARDPEGDTVALHVEEMSGAPLTLTKRMGGQVIHVTPKGVAPHSLKFKAVAVDSFGKKSKPDYYTVRQTDMLTFSDGSKVQIQKAVLQILKSGDPEAVRALFQSTKDALYVVAQIPYPLRGVTRNLHAANVANAVNADGVQGRFKRQWGRLKRASNFSNMYIAKSAIASWNSPVTQVYPYSRLTLEGNKKHPRVKVPISGEVVVAPAAHPITVHINQATLGANSNVMIPITIKNIDSMEGSDLIFPESLAATVTVQGNAGSATVELTTQAQAQRSVHAKDVTYVAQLHLPPAYQVGPRANIHFSLHSRTQGPIKMRGYVAMPNNPTHVFSKLAMTVPAGGIGYPWSTIYLHVPRIARSLLAKDGLTNAQFNFDPDGGKSIALHSSAAMPPHWKDSNTVELSLQPNDGKLLQISDGKKGVLYGALYFTLGTSSASVAGWRAKVAWPSIAVAGKPVSDTSGYVFNTSKVTTITSITSLVQRLRAFRHMGPTIVAVAPSERKKTESDYAVLQKIAKKYAGRVHVLWVKSPELCASLNLPRGRFQVGFTVYQPGVAVHKSVFGPLKLQEVLDQLP